MSEIEIKDEKQIKLEQDAANWRELLTKYNFTDNKDIIFAELDKYDLYEGVLKKKDKLLVNKDKQLIEMQPKVLKIEKQSNILLSESNWFKEQLATLEQKFILKIGELKKWGDKRTLRIEKLQWESGELKKVKPFEGISWQTHLKMAWKKLLNPDSTGI